MDDTRADVGVHGFYKRGRPCLFDMRITDTDAHSQRHKQPDAVLLAHEKEKKRKYSGVCKELRKDFVPMVYSVDGMAGSDARAAEKQCAAYLAVKWRRQYSEMVHFVRVRMALALARSVSLCIRGSRSREPVRPFGMAGAALGEAQTWHQEW